MKRLTRSGGYTIVEVMIFLIITGVLLTSALLVFNGRQQRSQFTQGVREVDARIRTIINETSSGYYPNKGDIRCEISGGNPSVSTVGPNQQGANKGCLFLGRMLQFTSNSYKVYTVVGRQQTSTGAEVTELGPGIDGAHQTLITPTSTQVGWPDASETFTMPWGITVDRIVTTLSTPRVGSFGFLYSLGSYDSEGVNLSSGTTGLNSVVPPGTDLTSSPDAMVAATKLLTNAQQNPGRIVICLRSGGGDKQAAIVIGGNNNNTGTEVELGSLPGECIGA